MSDKLDGMCLTIRGNKPTVRIMNYDKIFKVYDTPEKSGLG